MGFNSKKVLRFLKQVEFQFDKNCGQREYFHQGNPSSMGDFLLFSSQKKSDLLMIKEFEGLREDEVNLLLDAPVLVAILIAGADGNIDKSERKEAIETARNKQSRAREQLLDYYQLIGDRFEDRFNALIVELPEDAQEREQAIVSELRKLNFIFKKIDKSFTVTLYASLKETAKRIAESSGGILGYLSVGYEEQKLLDLKMIHDPAK